MEEQEVIAWIQKQATGARAIFCVCTGALLCGAAGPLEGRRATTHWPSYREITARREETARRIAARLGVCDLT
jgi:transcriptional regulator GlxA family with amidase domain